MVSRSLDSFCYCSMHLFAAGLAWLGSGFGWLYLTGLASERERGAGAAEFGPA